MTQLNRDQYRRLTKSHEYANDDGLFYDTTNDLLVLVMDGVVKFSLDASGNILAGAIEAPDLYIASQARGDLLRRGASAWERVSAKDSGKIVLGDGTDVISAAMSGHATINAAGVVTLDPTLIQYATVAISAADIVATGAGKLGHASGYPLVAAPAAGYAIELISAVIAYTYATAAYTGGGDVSVNYGGGGSALSGVVSAANSIGASANKEALLLPTTPTNNQLVSATGINLVAASAFTQPGTAAGTVSVKVAYRVHNIGF